MLLEGNLRVRVRAIIWYMSVSVFARNSKQTGLPAF